MEAGMPEYKFSIRQGGVLTHESSFELLDEQAAWGEATRACGEILKDIDGDLRKGGDLRILVTESTGQPLFTIRVSSIVHTGGPFP
jgi:hypothetical protein